MGREHDTKATAGGLPVRPRARPDVVFRRVGEDWLLFDPTTQEVHVLNLSAALVWSSCTGEMDLPTIIGDVADAFENDDVEGHVVEILDRFETAGLLVSDDPSEGPDSSSQS